MASEVIVLDTGSIMLKDFTLTGEHAGMQITDDHSLGKNKSPK